MDVLPSVLAFCVVRALTGSPGLVCRESTGLVSTAFTDDPLARFALLSSACAAPAALPCAPAPERSAATVPWPEAWAPAGFWADDVAANSSAVAARQSGPERCRTGIAMISFARSVGRRFSDVELFPGPRAPSIVGGLRPGEGDMFGSTWNTGARSSSRGVLYAARPTVAKHAQDARAVPRGRRGFWSEGSVFLEPGRV